MYVDIDTDMDIGIDIDTRIDIGIVIDLDINIDIKVDTHMGKCRAIYMSYAVCNRT